MNDEPELTGIRTLRLFPLPGLVFFPHSILPLHIFEPRYRQMTADALADDGLITMVMVRETQAPGAPDQPPELEEFACVGRIFKYNQHPDGRYDLLLVGLKRVRLIREVATAKLYRMAEAEIVEDSEDGINSMEKKLLVEFFRKYTLASPAGGVDPDLDAIISGDLSLGILTDILAHTLPLPPASKQELLAEPAPSNRAWLLMRSELFRPYVGDVFPVPSGSIRVTKGQFPGGYPLSFSDN